MQSEFWRADRLGRPKVLAGAAKAKQIASSRFDLPQPFGPACCTTRQWIRSKVGQPEHLFCSRACIVALTNYGVQPLRKCDVKPLTTDRFESFHTAAADEELAHVIRPMIQGERCPSLVKHVEFLLPACWLLLVE